MLMITGDIHGDPISRFSYKIHPSLRDTSRKDYMVILGDWGIVFNDQYKKDAIYKLNWLNGRKFTTVALLGNHDNWDWALSLPKIETEIGEVRQCVYDGKIYDNIYIVADPCVLNIDGAKCLCIPGAESHDCAEQAMDSAGEWHSKLRILDPQDPDFKAQKRNCKANKQFYRVKGQSWWPQEAIDTETAGDIVKLIADNEVFIDFVFTHDYPAYSLDFIQRQLPSSIKEMPTKGQKFLNRIVDTVNFDAWFHGHMHIDDMTTYPQKNIWGVYGSILVEE